MRPIHRALCLFVRPIHMYVPYLFPCLNDQSNVIQEADNDKAAGKDVLVMRNHLEGKSGSFRGLAIQSDFKLSDPSNSKSEQKQSGEKSVLIAPDPQDAMPKTFSMWTEGLASQPEKKPVQMPVQVSNLFFSHPTLTHPNLFVCYSRGTATSPLPRTPRTPPKMKM